MRFPHRICGTSVGRGGACTIPRLYCAAAPRQPRYVFPRFLYTFVMYLLTPVILFRLARRGLHYRSYLGRWRERFGFFPAPGFTQSIWIHAVSVGEVNAAVPLIEALMRDHADLPFVISNT